VIARYAPALLVGLGLTLTRPAVVSAACDVSGRVVDAEERPMPGMAVRLIDGAAPRHAVTDADGRFAFAAVPGPAEVFVTLGEGGASPRFVLLRSGAPLELSAAVDPAQSCEVSLGPPHAPGGPERGADVLDLYGGLRRGFALMEQLGIRPTRPLQVMVDDPIAAPDDAYWVGPSSFNPDDDLAPRMVLGTRASTRDDLGAPDDREYHELGHHALATAFGALPRARDEVPGGGYHRAPVSSEAWTEGFAIFFSALVAREIEQRPDAGRYRVAGAWLDLELDYRPWDLRGTESVAVASLLWDVVDGDRAASGPTLEVLEPRLVVDGPGPPRLVGQVRNPTDTEVTAAHVRVEGPGFTGTAPVAPRTLPPGGEGWFVLPAPASIAEAEDPLAGLHISATTIPAAPDDDPLHASPAAVWAAIAGLRSEHPDANGHLIDVSELYRALHEAFGGDADGDGRDDVDQLFIAHGLYADLDGDRTHDPDEPLGLTSHPARTVEVDGASVTWPEMRPRHRLELPAGLRMQVEAAPSSAMLVVLVSGSSWGGYMGRADPDGLLTILPPPAVPGAHVSLAAMAPDHEPALPWHEDAEALLDQLERHTTPFLSTTAELSAAGRSSARTPPWARFVFAGGAMAALLGLGLVALGWPRLR